MASDELSDVFRSNVQRVIDAQGLNHNALNQRMGAAKGLVRTQILARAGTSSITLASVERYAAALGVDPLELLTPPSRERAA